MYFTSFLSRDILETFFNETTFKNYSLEPEIYESPIDMVSKQYSDTDIMDILTHVRREKLQDLIELREF